MRSDECAVVEPRELFQALIEGELERRNRRKVSAKDERLNLRMAVRVADQKAIAKPVPEEKLLAVPRSTRKARHALIAGQRVSCQRDCSVCRHFLRFYRGCTPKPVGLLTDS